MGVLTMNARELADQADQVAENGMFKLLGRFMMFISGPATVWLGVTVWTMYGDLTKVTVQLDSLTQRIDTLVKSQYRDTDAVRDLRVRDQKDAEQDRRILENSDRIRVLESRINSAPK